MIGIFSSKNHTLKKFSANGLVVVCHGNSLTAGGFGLPAGTPYPTLLNTDLGQHITAGQYTVHNKGTGGIDTDTMEAQAAAQVDVLIEQGKTNVLVFWELGNDLYGNGNVTTCYNNAVTYCQNRVAAGWKVIVCTTTPRDTGGNTFFGDTPEEYNVKLKQLNALIRLNWQTQGLGERLCDLEIDTRLSYPNTTYYTSDLIHLRQAGNEVVRDLILNTLRKISI